jgi:hypothetical protein
MFVLGFPETGSNKEDLIFGSLSATFSTTVLMGTGSLHLKVIASLPETPRKEPTNFT